MLASTYAYLIFSDDSILFFFFFFCPGASQQTHVWEVVAVAGVLAALVRPANSVAIRRALADRLYATLSPTETVMPRLLLALLTNHFH